jgi:ribosomal protein L11 methyltransferase
VAAPWKLLDLGSGSGILALAGRLFGARTALGLDNDPKAVRTARENAALNGMREVKFQRADLLGNWQPEAGSWPVITANLFSELLTALLPRIRTALAKDGSLIASGVLASQAAELESSLRQNDLETVVRRRRGKWTAFLIRHAA